LPLWLSLSLSLATASEMHHSKTFDVVAVASETDHSNMFDALVVESETDHSNMFDASVVESEIAIPKGYGRGVLVGVSVSGQRSRLSLI
jgi:hypothetical protein